MIRPPARPVFGALLAAALFLAPRAASAQGAGDGDRWRFGVSLGGITLVGLQVEYQRDSRGLEATVGTFSFKDIGASLVLKQYFGASALQPFVGGGVWVAAAAPRLEGEQTGVAFLVQAPVGVDWRFVGDQSLGLSINLNKALYVRRSNPEDDLPPAGGLVPLPGIYYRMAR